MNRENWSDKNTITYDEIFNKLHIFICSKCKNESRMKLSTFQNKKNWCKLCPKEPSKYKGENKLKGNSELEVKALSILKLSKINLNS